MTTGRQCAPGCRRHRGGQKVSRRSDALPSRWDGFTDSELMMLWTATRDAHLYGLTQELALRLKSLGYERSVRGDWK